MDDCPLDIMQAGILKEDRVKPHGIQVFPFECQRENLTEADSVRSLCFIEEAVGLWGVSCSPLNWAWLLRGAGGIFTAAGEQHNELEALTHGGRLRLQGAIFSLVTSGVNW